MIIKLNKQRRVLKMPQHHHPYTLPQIYFLEPLGVLSPPHLTHPGCLGTAPRERCRVKGLAQGRSYHGYTGA